MGAFRKRKSDFKYFGSPDPEILFLEKNERVQNDVTVIEENVISSSVKDYVITHPVPQEEATVRQQLDAGVSLSEIPVANMLDSRDNLDYDEDKLQQSVLEQLQENAE